jgi:hypothetical protein
MTRRREARVVSVLLAVVAFVLTHQFVFLYTYGAGTNAALARTGHGVGWSATVLAVLGAGAMLALIAMFELARLARRARAVAAIQTINPDKADEPLWALLDRTLRDALSIGVAVAAILVLTENAEHAAIGARLPGLSVFAGAEYSGTVPILVAVALATSLVRAMYHWRREVLIARLRAARRRLPRATAVLEPAPRIVNRRPRTNIGRRIASRAPPVLALN